MWSSVIVYGRIRSVGLIPYTGPDNARSLDDHYLMEAHRASIPDEEDYFFNKLQLQIYRDVVAGRNVVLSATTSVGKSMVVDAVIASGLYNVIAIIVPTIALIDETRRRLGRRFAQTQDRKSVV